MAIADVPGAKVRHRYAENADEVLHVTDGHPSDGNPEPAADRLKSLATSDGGCLLFNLHVDAGEPAVLAEQVSVGHHATVHGCRIEDDCLVGINAVVMDGAVHDAIARVATCTRLEALAIKGIDEQFDVNAATGTMSMSFALPSRTFSTTGIVDRSVPGRQHRRV